MGNLIRPAPPSMTLDISAGYSGPRSGPPRSSLSSRGPQALWAPRAVVSRWAASTSSTARAMALTPSPCSRWCAAISCAGPWGAEALQPQKVGFLCDRACAQRLLCHGSLLASRPKSDGTHPIKSPFGGVRTAKQSVPEAWSFRGVGRERSGGAQRLGQPPHRLRDALRGHVAEVEPERVARPAIDGEGRTRDVGDLPIQGAAESLPRVDAGAGRHPHEQPAFRPRPVGVFAEVLLELRQEHVSPLPVGPVELLQVRLEQPLRDEAVHGALDQPRRFQVERFAPGGDPLRERR